jgi:outer membrane lipoprotein SlyB
MNTSKPLAALMIACAAVLGGCASTSSTSPYSTTTLAAGYGTIDSIQVTRVAGSGTSGGGAIVGGVLGALVGNQVGSGNGRTAATVAGAAGGAYVGNQMEANRQSDAYQINVRLDNGGYQSVVQDSVIDLRVGQRVRIVDGRVYRY